MPETVNIAEEIAAVCAKLNNHTDVRGGDFLADCFGVEAWSADFFRIVAAILTRLVELEAILDSLPIRSAAKGNIRTHITEIRGAFDRHSLSAPWRGGGQGKVSSDHSDPILSLSTGLHAFDFEQPTLNEIKEFQRDGTELLEWLETHQIEEHDFIRACLINGVREFLFRLDKLGWVGWSYTAESLRDVIGAYLALERGLDPQAYPKTAALLQKVLAKLARPLGLIAKGREVKDGADFVIAAFEGASALAKPAGAFVAGLLSGS